MISLPHPVTRHGDEEEVDALVEGIAWDKRVPIAHGADPTLLGEGRVFSAAQSATEWLTWDRVRRCEGQR